MRLIFAQGRPAWRVIVEKETELIRHALSDTRTFRNVGITGSKEAVKDPERGYRMNPATSSSILMSEFRI